MGITQMLLALGNNDTLETLGLHTNNLQDKGADCKLHGRSAFLLCQQLVQLPANAP